MTTGDGSGAGTRPDTARPGADDGLSSLLDDAAAAREEGLLTAAVFNDERVHEAELWRVFAREWVFVGHESEIPDAGDYVRRYVGNDPYVFVRGTDGEARVLFDSCRHRGTKICRSDAGNTSHFRCPYHGWTYNTKGELVGVPQKSRGFDDLDRSEWGLHAAPRTDSYAGLVFASLAEEGPSLAEHLGEFTWYLDVHFKLGRAGMEVVGTPHRWEIDANWKTAAENLSNDSYHGQITHHTAGELGLTRSTGTMGPLSDSNVEKYHVARCGGHSGAIKFTTDDDASVFFGYPDEVVETFDGEALTDEQFDLARRSINHSGTVFPNLSFIHIGATEDPAEPAKGFLVLQKWQPVAPDTTQVWNWILVPGDAPGDYRERAYRAGTSAFSPAGSFEVDDVAVWNGIATTAGSVTARKAGMELNYQMGMDGKGGRPVDDWPGPGEVYDLHLNDFGLWTFHGHWLARMREEGRHGG